MLEVKNFTCVRNTVNLFQPIQFALAYGEVLQIAGNNGVGKTTLLKTVAGLLPDYAGEIKLTPQQICYLGHRSALHPQLTVAQNLHFFYSLHWRNDAKIISLRSALEYFNVGHKMMAMCKDLSAGQQQRVNLSKLLLTQAKIWLLDEPLINLDAQGTNLLQDLCKQHLAASGVLLIATHRYLELDPYVSKKLILENLL